MKIVIETTDNGVVITKTLGKGFPAMVGQREPLIEVREVAPLPIDSISADCMHIGSTVAEYLEDHFNQVGVYRHI